MILLMHILSALVSVGVTTVVFRHPTTKRLVVSYGFIIATVVSGSALIIENPAGMLRACTTGLLYVTVVTILTIATYLRVRARQAQDSSTLPR